MSEKVNIFWFRRDLRLHDNAGFSKALSGKFPVLPIFIFDKEILRNLPEDDARVTFIFETLQSLQKDLQKFESDISIYHGKPKVIFSELISEFEVQNVITNCDYEPYATERDLLISEYLSENHVGFYTFKDQVIFEKDEIAKDDGSPYVVYTPYSKKWLEKFDEIKDTTAYPFSNKTNNLYKNTMLCNLSLKDLGFTKSPIKVKPYKISENVLENYKESRNFPAEAYGTSNISPHLRFGTVSIRAVVKRAIKAKNNTYLKELIWREFFMQILWHYPKTVNYAFKPKYDRIEWINNEKEFEAWMNGKTGYPFVDAGMRQLNETGYMHNRVRMIVASFLCKHLLIDWRWGEAYFAQKLLDYELSSNVGNWQWAAGSGVDAAPYFRIFNPTSQIKKFDKDLKYIKNWVPELDTDAYPMPIVNHKEARERCLNYYKAALNN